MKVLALVILLVIGSSSGLGSGPYLPSGWRPSGPAFHLPSEAEKPVIAIPLKDVPVQETETSGSSFLREYGPPTAGVQITETKFEVQSLSSSSDALREASKVPEEVSQELTQQALPDSVTEQAFIVIETPSNEEAKSAEVVQEAVSEQLASADEADTVTESEITEKQISTESEALTQGKSLEVESQTESSLAVEEESTENLVEAVEEKTAEITEQAKSEEVKQEVVATQLVEASQEQSEKSNSIVAAVEVRTEEIAEVKSAEEGVKNIAEALVNLENEIKAQQVQTIQEVTEVRTSSQENSGTLQQTPEGFLEYGPPGFTEYGPPKGDLRAVAEQKESESSFETNETRRRRFSPKFKTPKRH